MWPCKLNMYAKFLKTGDIYEILNDKCEMKNPETGEWSRAVSYQKYKVLNNGNLIEPGPEFEGRIFVREFKDFSQKFEPCLGI